MEMNFRIILQLTAFLLALGIIYNLLTNWERKDFANLVLVTGVVMVLTFLVSHIITLFRAIQTLMQF